MVRKTSDDLRKEIQLLIAHAGIDAVAERLGVSVNYVYMLLAGSRPISRGIAKQLGYDKIRPPRPEPEFIPHQLAG